MSYPEQRFRHRQDGTCHVGAHQNWGPIVIGHNSDTGKPYTMADSGCMTDAFAYLASRFFGLDMLAGDLANYLNRHGGYTRGGLMVWDKASQWAKGMLVLSSRWDKTYTMRAVVIGGRIVHWLVDLRGGYAKDPLSGDILSPADLKARFASGKWQDTSIRRYIKAMRKPAT